jgi:hypothetical protein
MYATRSEGGVEGICCQGCELQPEGTTSIHFDSPGDALFHLYEHKKAGHMVDRNAIERLQRQVGEIRDPLPKNIFKL